MRDRLGQLEAINGITAEDLAAAGNAPGATAVATDDTPTLAERFDDPAVQDAILNPPTLDLESEVPVSDWTCARRHVTTTSGVRPDRCATCRDRELVGPDDRIARERYTLRLAFTDHDIRRRKVYEHINALRTVLLREMLHDNPRAQLDAGWIDRNPGTAMVGFAAVATRNKTREVLAYLADCPYDLVDGIASDDLTLAASTLLGIYRDYVEARASKAATTSGAASGQQNSAPGSSATGSPSSR